MSTRTIKRCPHCGKVYESYSSSTKHYYTRQGSPFIRCRFCGYQFVDDDIKEPALKPYKGKGYSILNCIFAFFFPFGLAGFFLTGCAIKEETRSIGVIIAAVIIDLLYIGLTIFAFKNRKSLKEDSLAEYEASVERLSDREYALALQKAGFKVPEKYLSEDNIIPDETLKELRNNDLIEYLCNENDSFKSNSNLAVCFADIITYYNVKGKTIGNARFKSFAKKLVNCGLSYDSDELKRQAVSEGFSVANYCSDFLQSSGLISEAERSAIGGEITSCMMSAMASIDGFVF